MTNLVPLDHERILDVVELGDENCSALHGNVKIYEIKTLEHTLLEKNEYELAEKRISVIGHADFAS